MPDHHKIDYVEFASADPKKTRDFFAETFAWSFEDYGDDYIAFSGAGLDGGIYRADLKSSADNGGALVVFYSQDIEATQSLVTTHGARIVKPIFSFPGGRRFHFTEPMGNELAVWSDK